MILKLSFSTVFDLVKIGKLSKQAVLNPKSLFKQGHKLSITTYINIVIRSENLKVENHATSTYHTSGPM